MKLSILLPVYNESASLETLLAHLLPLALDKEIIAVDDCSRDNSAAILEKYANENFRVVRHQINRGKSAAST